MARHILNHFRMETVFPIHLPGTRGHQYRVHGQSARHGHLCPHGPFDRTAGQPGNQLLAIGSRRVEDVALLGTLAAPPLGPSSHCSGHPPPGLVHPPGNPLQGRKDRLCSHAGQFPDANFHRGWIPNYPP